MLPFLNPTATMGSSGWTVLTLLTVLTLRTGNLPSLPLAFHSLSL